MSSGCNGLCEQVKPLAELGPVHSPLRKEAGLHEPGFSCIQIPQLSLNRTCPMLRRSLSQACLR